MVLLIRPRCHRSVRNAESFGAPPPKASLVSLNLFVFLCQPPLKSVVFSSIRSRTPYEVGLRSKTLTHVALCELRLWFMRTNSAHYEKMSVFHYFITIISLFYIPFIFFILFEIRIFLIIFL